MSATPANTRVNLIPCLRYRDAPAAIEWLCRAFGFEQHAVYPDQNNGIAHAQLSFGNGMIMLGSAGASDSEYGRLMKLPDDIGGAQTVYVVVADADAAYAQAREAGAKVVMELADADYGGRGFTCRDLENYVWSFGTYDPYAQGE